MTTILFARLSDLEGIETDLQAAIDAVEAALDLHVEDKENPHETGLSNLADYDADENVLTNLGEPVDPTDAARKAEVDAVASDLADHEAEEDAPVHGSTSAATAGKLVHRDAEGRAKVAAPDEADDIARKAEVDAHADRTDNPHGVTAAQAGALAILANLSDLDDAAEARDNLGLGTAATEDFEDLGIQSVQVFTSSDTWTRPAGITRVVVEVLGGGGGGGASAATSGGESSGGSGGGGGGYAKRLIDVSAIASATVTVGAGGAGGSSGGASGSTGGTSEWDDGTNVVAATGGGLGSGGGASSGTRPWIGGLGGGVGSGGHINVSGQGGGYGFVAGTVGGGGFGGNSGKGGGGTRQIAVSVAEEGSDGDMGGGGGGGAVGESQTFVNGGDGGDGIVIVWEFR
jgi:hypothetical protein